ncbi:hypothetical protein J7E83_01935 [Arthrobacter sp. ISL-48]|uniref:hypothetical protein n=1 Tax=Arthrobacter sp. ISL-48 TaxID=2819110 RepID=UPI001BECC526|nr:hypothetical protein [Arthrobacter sp. ISL-48]MBT2530902.1 hypothetical protein [Arthrobacter sp. ISL-48]
MNTTPGPAGQQRTDTPLSEAAKSSLSTTHNLFRIFVLTVLGSFFVLQLDLNYLWLTAILTTASFVLGILLLIRAAQLKESRMVLFGTISGLVVSLVMVLVILAVSAFFNEFRDFQDCTRVALTDQGMSQCRIQLEKSVPMQLR